MEVTLNHPPILKPAAVKLTRKWSEWDKGDIIITDAAKADRMIAKNYGHLVKIPKKPSTTDKSPKVETADAIGPSQAEKQVAEPVQTESEKPQAGSAKRGEGGN